MITYNRNTTTRSKMTMKLVFIRFLLFCAMITLFLHLYTKETLVIRKFIDHLLHMFGKTKSNTCNACMIHDPNIYKASITEVPLPKLEATKSKRVQMFTKTTNNINKFSNKVYITYQ